MDYVKMEKYAWKGSVKEGCMEEYIRRHDNLPEDATRKGAHQQRVRDQRKRVKGGKSYVDAEYLW